MLNSTVFCTVLTEFSAPTAPIAAEKYLPADVESFGDGLWYVLKQGLAYVAPDLTKAAGVCCSIIAVALLVSILHTIFDASNRTYCLVGVIAICTLLLNTTGTLINLCAETILEISEYGKLLAPVLCSALAAQGSTGSAVILYSGTIIFNSVLSAVLSKILVPGIYIYVGVSIANSALGDAALSNLSKIFKDTITWVLKTALYLFTGYMTVTGVVSGSVDAASLKATKLAISGAVPVIGGILADASEAFLAGVQIAKNSVGITGLFTILAIWIGPFLKVGAQYILLRLSSAVCGVLNEKNISKLLVDISGAMGLLLAAIGAVGFIHVLSTVCFIRGTA